VISLAHWTFTQRTIHVVLPIKPATLGHGKLNPASTLGDAIRAARHKANMTRQQLSVVTGIQIYWLGRWERDRLIPNELQWMKLGKILTLPAIPSLPI
jgi:DNA-binding transcriptional regulator YiaG